MGGAFRMMNPRYEKRVTNLPPPETKRPGLNLPKDESSILKQKVKDIIDGFETDEDPKDLYDRLVELKGLLE